MAVTTTRRSPSRRRVKLWSVGARACTATLTEHTDFVWCVAVSAEAIATGSLDSTARLWPVGGGASRHALRHPGSVFAVALAGDLLATGCYDKVIRTFAVGTGAPTRELRESAGTVCSLALSGSALVSGDRAQYGLFLFGGDDDENQQTDLLYVFYLQEKKWRKLAEKQQGISPSSTSLVPARGGAIDDETAC